MSAILLGLPAQRRSITPASSNTDGAPAPRALMRVSISNVGLAGPGHVVDQVFFSTLLLGFLVMASGFAVQALGG